MEVGALQESLGNSEGECTELRAEACPHALHAACTRQCVHTPQHWTMHALATTVTTTNEFQRTIVFPDAVLSASHDHRMVRVVAFEMLVPRQVAMLKEKLSGQCDANADLTLRLEAEIASGQEQAAAAAAHEEVTIQACTRLWMRACEG